MAPRITGHGRDFGIRICSANTELKTVPIIPIEAILNKLPAESGKSLNRMERVCFSIKGIPKIMGAVSAVNSQRLNEMCLKSDSLSFTLIVSA